MRPEWQRLTDKFSDEELIEMSGADHIKIYTNKRLGQHLTQQSAFKFIAKALAQRLWASKQIQKDEDPGEYMRSPLK